MTQIEEVAHTLEHFALRLINIGKSLTIEFRKFTDVLLHVNTGCCSAIYDIYRHIHMQAAFSLLQMAGIGSGTHNGMESSKACDPRSSLSDCAEDELMGAVLQECALLLLLQRKLLAAAQPSALVNGMQCCFAH